MRFPVTSEIRNCPGSPSSGGSQYFQIATELQAAIDRLYASFTHERGHERSDAAKIELRDSLRAAGELLDCDLVLLWEPDPKEIELGCRIAWNSFRLNTAGIVEPLTKIVLWPVEGLPGRAWASARGQTLSELADDRHSERSMLFAKAGIRSAVAFPISDGDQVRYVLEFLAIRRNAFQGFPDALQQANRSLAERKETAHSEIGAPTGRIPGQDDALICA